MGVAPKSAASVHAGGGDLRWLNQLAAISESPHAKMLQREPIWFSLAVRRF